MAQQFEDLVSLLWLGSLQWQGLNPGPKEIPHATGMDKKKKKKKKGG